MQVDGTICRQQLLCYSTPKRGVTYVLTGIYLYIHADNHNNHGNACVLHMHRSLSTCTHIRVEHTLPPTQGDTHLRKCCQAGQWMGGLTPSWKVTGFDPRMSPTCILHNITALLKTYSGWSITVTWCAFFFGTPLNGSNSVNYKSNIKKTTVIYQTRWISADYVDRGTTAL